jgi:hypothetical protein
VSDRPPFDPIRAAFWLLAFVIGVYGAVILAFAGACLYHAEIIISQTSPDVNCDPNARLMGLLAAALAAALAFAGVKKDK